MKEPCEHFSRMDGEDWGIWHDRDGRRCYAADGHHQICMVCHELVSCGKAKDTRAVRIEIQAADIASRASDDMAPEADGVGVDIGWDAHRDGTDWLETKNRKAGWLAREIAMHGREQG